MWALNGPAGVSRARDGAGFGLAERRELEEPQDVAARPLIAGNWKMHGLSSAIVEALAVADAAEEARASVAICPPATLLHRICEALDGSRVRVGGQDIHPETHGAYTGDISAEMLADCGADLVIVGHSERRRAYGESSEFVARKVRAAVRAGLEPIVCVGESLDARERGDALAVVTGQVRESLPAELAGKPFAVAYEPFWAIGAGVTPTLDEIAEVHAAIRDTLQSLFGEASAQARILYGGSVSPNNASAILRVANVGGALVGGCSLKAEEFLQIVRAA